jgi:hypothetical protein
MTMRDVVERHGHFAHVGNPDDTTEAWLEATETVGFKVSAGDL